MAIFQAFLEERTWKQSDLAFRVQISVKQLRRRLTELQRHGLPLERQEERPHVYWSLPSGWTPGGVLFDDELLAETLELLQRLSPTTAREGVVTRILARAGWRVTEKEWAVHVGSHGDENDQLWTLSHLAVKERKALRLDYQSATSPRRIRIVSPQRVWKGRATHLIAYCHEARALRRFHFARVRSAWIEEAEKYIEVPSPKIATFLQESIDGYHEDAPAVAIRFVVPTTDARWVLDNLPDGLTGRVTNRGLEVNGRVTSVEHAACHVASLGGIAKEMSPELAAAVRRIARKLLRGS